MRICQFLRKEQEGAASELLDRLMEDAEQWKAFVESAHLPLFRNVLDAHAKYLRSSINAAESGLEMVRYMKADLRYRPWKERKAKFPVQPKTNKRDPRQQGVTARSRAG